MKKNLGIIDRIARAAFAVTMAVLYFTGVISGTTAIVLLAVSGILLATSFIGFCPIYFSIGLSSKKKNQSADHG